MPHTLAPVQTTKKYPFPPHKPGDDDDIDYDDDEDRDDDPDDDDDDPSDDDDDEFFYGLFTTPPNVETEEITSETPQMSVAITESKIMQAISEKDFPASVTEGGQDTPVTPVIPLAEPALDLPVTPVIPFAEPAFDPPVGAVKDKKGNEMEEENKMNMNVIPTHMVNSSMADFHDRDDLTE